MVESGKRKEKDPYHSFLLTRLQSCAKAIILEAVTSQTPIYDSFSGIVEFLSVLESILAHKLDHKRSMSESPSILWSTICNLKWNKISSKVRFLESIKMLSEVKTDAGRARAWLKLTLNQKIIADCFEAFVQERNQWYVDGALIFNDENCLTIQTVLMGLTSVCFLLSTNEKLLDFPSPLLNSFTEHYFYKHIHISESPSRPVSSNQGLLDTPKESHSSTKILVEQNLVGSPNESSLDKSNTETHNQVKTNPLPISSPPLSASVNTTISPPNVTQFLPSHQNLLSSSTQSFSPPITSSPIEDPCLNTSRILEKTNLPSFSWPSKSDLLLPQNCHTKLDTLDWESDEESTSGALWDSQLETGFDDDELDFKFNKSREISSTSQSIGQSQSQEDSEFAFIEEDQNAVLTQTQIPVISKNVSKAPKSYPTSNRWLNDDSSDQCMGCDSKFSLTLRRHHCRCCGRLFCSRCTPHRAAIETHAYKPVRVCLWCHKDLMKGFAKDISQR
eukprot:TRINITY_DN2511_c0_g1_i1.p1 TRINITY_DN2511_c0_g1~~TRINITY_DN2511_c0_g1_i1.p1  ORF type:complete len:503 (+),score=94.59 TRINITY_DN2511_c0_g1_i1:100-1608(+)